MGVLVTGAFVTKDVIVSSSRLISIPDSKQPNRQTHLRRDAGCNLLKELLREPGRERMIRYR